MYTSCLDSVDSGILLDFTLPQFEVVWICKHAVWPTNNINQKAIHKEQIMYSQAMSVWITNECLYFMKSLNILWYIYVPSITVTCLWMKKPMIAANHIEEGA